jgi:hypothetical protein
MLRRGFLLLGLAALIIAGCGGGGRLSEDEYAARANSICADFNAKVKAVGSPGTSLDSLARYADRLIPIFVDGLGRLKKLKPPKDEQAIADQWLKNGDDQLVLVKELRDAAKKGDQAEVKRLGALSDANNKKSDVLARRLGATTCAQG